MCFSLVYVNGGSATNCNVSVSPFVFRRRHSLYLQLDFYYLHIIASKFLINFRVCFFSSAFPLACSIYLGIRPLSKCPRLANILSALLVFVLRCGGCCISDSFFLILYLIDCSLFCLLLLLLGVLMWQPHLLFRHS